jgi:hypothetical protein
LKEKGIPTIDVMREQPAPAEDPLIPTWDEAQELAEAFIRTDPARNPVAIAGINEFMAALGKLQAVQRTPHTHRAIQWLGRNLNHVGGNDLLTPTRTPDFWSKKVTLTAEYRIHSFLGKSIRGGVKVPRDDVDFVLDGERSDWIRSWDGGWRISYAEGAVKQVHRNLAHKAVAALDLQFGAVDIGRKRNGDLIVLEVNRAPGIELGSLDVYANAVRRWIE